MAKRTLIEQLDDAVTGLLTSRKSKPRQLDPEVTSLLNLAADLRHLPRPAFRKKLKADLREPVSTAASPVSAQATATPYLTVQNAAQAIEFYKKAFGATEIMRLTEPGGRIGHAEIEIGGSRIMLADESPDYGSVAPPTLGGSPVKINLEVSDVDAVARQARAAGAKVVRPVEDQFYGHRSGQFADPFGYTWIISTEIESVSHEEMQRRFESLVSTPPKEVEKSATGKVNPIREGFHTITPYIAVREAHEVIDFIQKTFDAQGSILGVGSAGGIHAEYKIGDSMLMIGGSASWKGTPMPTALHVYVKDADATYKRALAAGATVIREPADMPYGDREAGVKDVAGNHWYIATQQVSASYIPAGFHAVTPYLHPKGAAKALDFMKRAFGAEETFRSESDNVIHHASLRLGSSMLSLGEAHAEFQPMPTMFYLYVEDTDALYKQAMAAGAKSLAAPADQPYGDRNAAVEDPFGNQWYIATHVRDPQ